jgi:two-component system, NarL family, sensor kinase
MAPGHFVPAIRPRTSTLMHAVATLAVGAGCVGLTIVQRSRVLTTSRALAERERLLRQLLDVECRERRQLSERLHDEALQYVLAARMDLEEACDRLSPDTVRRIEVALSRASAFLQATVGELRPVVLEQWDLPGALRQLTQTMASDSGSPIAVDSVRWPSGARTSVDGLLFGTARQLLSHIQMQAGVARISVSLELLGERATLQLRADGTGIGQHEMKGQFTTSTTELGAYLVRIEAAGGTVQCTPAPTTGLIVTVSCRQRPSRSAFPLGRYGLLELVECH